MSFNNDGQEDEKEDESIDLYKELGVKSEASGWDDDDLVSVRHVGEGEKKETEQTDNIETHSSIDSDESDEFRNNISNTLSKPQKC